MSVLKLVEQLLSKLLSNQSIECIGKNCLKVSSWQEICIERLSVKKNIHSN